VIQQTMRLLHVGLKGLLSVLLVGCAGSAPPKPEPLKPLVPQIASRVVWSQQLSAVNLPLNVSSQADSFVVAGSNGIVAALDAISGRFLWRGNAQAEIGAGVGSDGRFSAVVTRDGELVLFEQGDIRWRHNLGVRVYTAPLVIAGRVFVLGADRSVQAFDVLDGSKLWALQQPTDPLTLAQPGVLLAFKNTLVAGQGSRMVGLDPVQGSLVWDVPVGAPRGANEIERLADLVGPAARVGGVICARAYQVAVSCINAQNPALAWSKNTGGLTGLAADKEFVWGTDASGRMTAWYIDSGNVAWTSDQLRYRNPTAPLLWRDSVVWGDADGMVHGFSRDTGQPQFRLPTDGSAIAAAPVVAGATLLVITRKGSLFALRAE
jgi:outer membrane protein assembly factor BamB